jgi:hypothetical protein
MRPLLAALVLLLAAGCAGIEPFEPPVAGEMNPGPGLVFGPSGEFVLLRRGGAWDEVPAGAAEPATAMPDLTKPPPE